jgi:hypothetical protein
MARTWLSIRVDLIEGRGERCWPRPGRIFAASRRHTFSDLADAIDTAFSRWDRSHLTLFELSDGRQVYGPIEWDDPPEHGVYGAELRLSRLTAGEQLAYTFDMGDDWTHLCTVSTERIDPLRELGIVPNVPHGGRSPTSTDAALTPMTARARCRPTPTRPTCPRSTPTGARAPRDSRRTRPPSWTVGSRLC